MDATSKQMQHCQSENMTRFEARNNAQVFLARDLTRAYSEYYALRSFQQRLLLPDVTDSLRTILHLIVRIYGFWCLERHLATFYQGRFDNTNSTGSFASTVRTELLNACGALKDSAVAVVDALAPPDFALNSVIGRSDGLVSKIGKPYRETFYQSLKFACNFTPFDFFCIPFKLYENIRNEFMTNPGAMERAPWWKEVRLAKSKL